MSTNDLSPLLDIIPVPETSTVTLNEWIDYMAIECKKNTEFNLVKTMHVPSAQFLADAPTVKGFMTSPCAVYKGKVLEAKSVEVPDIEVFKEYLAGFTTDVFLYQVFWYYSVPYFAEVDKNGCIIPTNSVKFTPSKWAVRFATLDNHI